MANAIEFEKVTKVYRPGFFRRHIGVENFTLNIPEGRTFGLLGPNGSGKTTFIKLILGLIHPDKGRIRIFGEPPGVRTLARIGFLPELLYYHDFLTPVEILKFYGALYGMKPALIKQRAEEVLSQVGLTAHSGRRLKTFSKGMLQRLGVAQAVINDPDILILDEPTMGLDPIGLKDFFEMIARMKERGKTIVFSSHQLVYAQDICDECAIINNGKLLYRADVDKKQSLEEIFIEKVGADT
jgi:ABC-2 type transport system ATP-binding protein